MGRISVFVFSLVAFFNCQSECLKADEVIRVMPIGDSITAGFHGTPSGTYRATVSELLSGAGINVDMVGDFARGSGDADHHGVSGYSIERMIDEYGSAVQRHDPDFALVLAGTNNHFSPPDFDAFVERYEQLFSMIRNNSTDVSIIVSTVPGFGYDRPNTPSWTREFVDNRNAVIFPNMNRAIEAVAANHADVTVVDLFSEIDIEVDISEDGVHPNLFGQQKLGSLFGSELISQINAVPEPMTSTIVLLAIMLLMAVVRCRPIVNLAAG